MAAQLTITDRKHVVHADIERMAVFLQGKFVEATGDDGRLWYVFFYKDHYLNAIPATKIKRGSKVAQAFRDCIVLEPPHPLIDLLFQPGCSFKTIHFAQLTGKMEKLFPPLEAAWIATFFESFVPKRKLFEYIQSIFYEYRRNGQLLQCARILRILKDFAPKQSWVKQMSRDLNLIKYDKLFQSYSPELIRKDPLYAEKLLYEKMPDAEAFAKLCDLLRAQNRWADEIALSLEQMESSPTDTGYKALLERLDAHFEEAEKMAILENLYARIRQFEPLQQDLLKFYIETKQLEKMIPMMLEEQIQLSAKQAEKVEKMLESWSPDDGETDVEALNRLAPLFSGHPAQAEKFVVKCISYLLQHRDTSYILEWLLPFKKAAGHLPAIRKVEQMHQMADDPDKQSLLGELYFEFGQYDRALDCFSWEMELRENDPAPVKWLSKIYHELGMQAESNAYRNLYIDMEKRRA
ncbi:hypothetical protein P9695_12730 [Weizmannia sp. CD-2023]|uniref:hypothetical protein n=1 Tax=Heyndrickxia TaxID=2837504 RepID=UPI000D73F603|nr:MULTISPECIES: hypothetical protein [Heyndrickxia]AWP35874.1 hypothetical protein CYJ15_02105 [Heyndrickxia coagulans]MEC2224292.1 hypothetical protein [Weizmannia sp. CD-2023]MED4841141.1 hypothetical protein [Weizmannia sp. CD-2023]MED4902171.1 hypothetical protein [Weizmannia sp. CD-2023]QDI61372.1 hypothetical protein DXF96_07665 [Heyndrickxia coagulans]